MPKYDYHKLKEAEKLPDDVNKYVEDKAKKYGSNNLLEGLVNIREKRIFTRRPGAYLQNIKTNMVLCWIDAHKGVVKDFAINKITLPKGYDKNLLVDIWADENTMFVCPDSDRNKSVDFYQEKNKKNKPTLTGENHAG